ncbi:MAG: hypothetical protein LBG43_01130 [Treponema sp.]|nr:hypothetical protein [Treponema sp.]
MIDRRVFITRHNPLRTTLEKEAPFSVGNGVFCFTAEYAAGEEAFPLCSMDEWGWRSYTGAPKDDSRCVSSLLTRGAGTLATQWTRPGKKPRLEDCVERLQVSSGKNRF